MAGPKPPLPFPAPNALPAPARWSETLPIDALRLEPTRDWAAGFREVWTPGEESAWGQVERMLDEGLPYYPARRDRPDLLETSRLSSHLHFGEISPRQLWHAIDAQATRHVAPDGFGAASALL
jgi:deoxyribodipyrimidine photo-lyase